MPEIKGDFDMGEMMKIFAAKTPPDNTIKRIENLESMVTDLNDRLKNVNPTGPVEMPFDTQDLLQRVQSLENRANQSDRRFDKDEEVLADHERRIKALEAMDMTPAAAPTGEIDTASILKQVNMLRAETSSMRQDFNDYKTKVADDMAALRRELINYCDKEVKDLSTRVDKITDSLRHELERLRAEFETFKKNDHASLEARVAALEKKFLRLQEAMANLKIPEASGGGGVS